MKTLLLLLISVAATGQDFEEYNKANKRFIASVPQLDTVSWYTVDTLKGCPLYLTDLIEYQKECYNDSTYTHTFNPSPSWAYSCYKQTGNLATGYNFVIDCADSTHYTYTHKLNLIHDFTEWSKTKYGL